MKQDEKTKDEKEIEEAVINGYMEDADAAISEAEWKAYLNKRYEEIKLEYKSYVLQKRECEALGREELVNKLTPHFRNNFKARKWVVGELRLAGVPVEDKFIT